MIVLGIESSCDETAVAVVERGERNAVLAEAIRTQVELHAPFGGIVPEIAARSHYEAIDGLCRQALADARLSLADVGLLAVTQGPGLIGSLLVGTAFAKGLALASNLPLVAVDHVAAHIEAPFISHPEIAYPLLALVVSGGHTTLFYQEQKFQGRVLAKTRDDAAGEVMDKVAKHFGLGYPGGPLIDGLYSRGDAGRFRFTRPRMSDGGNDFSFSGYKSAVLRLAQGLDMRPQGKDFLDLMASFLRALVGYLVEKTLAPAAALGARSLIVSGGVSRNLLLRRRFGEACAERHIDLFLPEPRYCTDNAAMIAWLGYEMHAAFPGGNYRDLGFDAYSRAAFRENRRHR